MKMNNIEEISIAIKDAIQDSFPMTKIKCDYTWDLSTLIIHIDFYCYNCDESLAFTLNEETYTKIDDEFLSKFINHIGDIITEKEAEYATKRRSIRGNQTTF